MALRESLSRDLFSQRSFLFLPEHFLIYLSFVEEAKHLRVPFFDFSIFILEHLAVLLSQLSVLGS